MKLSFYFLALLACLTEMLLYAFFSAWVGWKNGGGTIPMGILLGIMVITWKVIVGLRKKTEKKSDDITGISKGMELEKNDMLYKWSILFKRGGVLQYEMLGDNIFSMLGYYEDIFVQKGNPITPWELFLRFNKSKEEIQLTRNCFSLSGNNISNDFYKKVERIDPDIYSINREEVFINRITGENIRIKTMDEMHNEMQDMIKRLSDGSYEEYQEKRDREMSFYKILRSIFHETPIEQPLVSPKKA